MKTVYLFSSEHGDVPVSGDMLQRPFVIRPLENHPFLTLEDFFLAVKRFIWHDRGSRLSEILKRFRAGDIPPESIAKIIIRYEKYGILYHILSIEIHSDIFIDKFALSVAMFRDAIKSLDREFSLLTKLNKRSGPGYIQEAYFKGDVRINHGNEWETSLIMLSKWFEGYHEWHFTGKKGASENAIIWDMENGYRYLSKKEIGRIIHVSSKILTFYYDTEDFRRIYPWHHGAGDFVVKQDKEGFGVKLISVRGYEQMGSLQRGGRMNPIEAIMFFFIELTIKMRIDRQEGMGDPVWAGDFIIRPILEGFVEGARLKDKKGLLRRFSLKDIIEKIKKISKQDLGSMVNAYMKGYRNSDPADFSFIDIHTKAHIAELYKMLKSF